ncbi:2-hydroxyacyl-CoA dehydratase family protein [bacterium]
MKEKIGFTSTIPIEILFAANKKPVDLNNIFITANDPLEYIDLAENIGFPRNYCSWIKGLCGVIIKHKIKKIIGIIQGDCTDTHSLLEVMSTFNIEVIPFSYPYNKDKKLLQKEITNLMKKFNVNWNELYNTHKKIAEVRNNVYKLDDMSYSKNSINSIKSRDLHKWHVSTSDFFSDYNKYSKELNKYLKNIEPNKNNYLKIGYIGIPPIITDLYDYIDSLNAKVIFNEVQRQFSFPYLRNRKINSRNFKNNYISQFLNYTYPYDVFTRLKDIKTEIKKRGLKGIIHYVQSFCHRQADDIIFRKELDVPILTLEEDRPGKISARSKIRIEAFLNIIRKEDRG